MGKGRILTDFISLFYPRICIHCNRALISKEEFLCLHCRLTLPISDIHNNSNEGLSKRLMAIPNLHQVHSYLNFNKGGIAQNILHEIKYKGQEELGKSIGEWFGYHILNKIRDINIDMIVPIPLHIAKRKRRGYNQSELIAVGLSNALGIACEANLLIRTKYTSTQTKKGKTERWLNVENIFKLNTSNVDIENKHILLVDDVITTGATIESAAYMLNQNGTVKISVACIASGR